MTTKIRTLTGQLLTETSDGTIVNASGDGKPSSSVETLHADEAQPCESTDDRPQILQDAERKPSPKEVAENYANAKQQQEDRKAERNNQLDKVKHRGHIWLVQWDEAIEPQDVLDGLTSNIGKLKEYVIKQGFEEGNNVIAYFKTVKRVQRVGRKWAKIGEHLPASIERVGRSATDRCAVVRKYRDESLSCLTSGVEDVNQSQSRSEAVVAKFANPFQAALANDPKEAFAYSKLFEMKQEYDAAESSGDESDEEDEIETKPYRWQRKLLRLLRRKPDKRMVYWRWDRMGKAGKSTFARHLREKYDAKVYTSTSNKNISYRLKEEREKGWKGNIVVFDLSRFYEDKHSIYGPIEGIKNRMVTSTKYKPGDVEFKRKFHVVVLCNFPPMKNLGTMSDDRWNVKNIGNPRKERAARDFIRHYGEEEPLKPLKKLIERTPVNEDIDIRNIREEDFEKENNDLEFESEESDDLSSAEESDM